MNTLALAPPRYGDGFTPAGSSLTVLVEKRACASTIWWMFCARSIAPFTTGSVASTRHAERDAHDAFSEENAQIECQTRLLQIVNGRSAH